MNHIEIPKLSNETANNIEGLLTYREISNALNLINLIKAQE